MQSKATKEIKSLPFEVKEISEDEEYLTFEGYASTFGNIDLGDDVIVRGAFSQSLSEQNSVPILWQHNMHEPVGISISLIEDEKGLFISAKLPKADQLVSGRVIPQMKAGSIREMSIGFFSLDDEIKEGIRYINKIRLFEVSLVTKAMNPQAQVTSFKSADSIKDVEKSLKELGLSNSEAKTLISKVKEFSIQRDVEEKQVMRDAELKSSVISNAEQIINILNKK